MSPRKALVLICSHTGPGNPPLPCRNAAAVHRASQSFGGVGRLRSLGKDSHGEGMERKNGEVGGLPGKSKRLEKVSEELAGPQMTT